MALTIPAWEGRVPVRTASHRRYIVIIESVVTPSQAEAVGGNLEAPKEVAGIVTRSSSLSRAIARARHESAETWNALSTVRVFDILTKTWVLSYRQGRTGSG